MIKTYFSNRIYKNTLAPDVVEIIQNSLVTFNNAKHYAYKLLLAQKRSGKSFEASIHMQVKTRYGINDYIANSAVQEANALISAQEELKKQYIKDANSQISSRNKKIKDLKKQIKNKQKMLQSIINNKFKAYPGANENVSDSGIYYVRHVRKYYYDIYFSAYDFEHIYLRPLISNLENRVRMIKYGLNKQEQKLSSISRKFNGVVFGSRKLFKAQYTIPEYIENHQRWIKDFRFARNKRMQISGRKDAKYGNFVFRYNPLSHEMEITLNNHLIHLQNIVFPYGQADVDKLLSQQIADIDRQPIAWEIEDHKNYYLFKVALKSKKNPANYYRGNGVIGYDLNYDHLAVVETDKYGNLTDKCIIPFDLDDKTTGQAAKILEQVAIDLVEIARIKKKPLVREDLDTTDSKSKLKYGSKKGNKKITQFAYAKFTDAVESRANKENVAVFKVNPAFTSQIGKVKYMKQKGLSIHESAAYVIARRGMGYKDVLPPVLFGMLPEKIAAKHHWAHWGYVSRFLKDVKPHFFYEAGKIDYHSLHSVKEFANQLIILTG
jgi:IS605 OrfB family transposase